MIKGWAILTAVEHDLEGIEENILQDIFFQIKVIEYIKFINIKF